MININETPEAIFCAKPYDRFYIDNHVMEFSVDTLGGVVFLSAPDPEGDFYYPWAHVRECEGRATFTRAELVNLIKTRGYQIK